MYALVSFSGKKNTIKRTTFPEVSKCPLQFIKITLHLVVSIVLQKHYFLAFSKKKTVNFTRSCAFAQKVKFYALQMLKKQNLTHPKAVNLATLIKPIDVLRGGGQGGLGPPPKIG